MPDLATVATASRLDVEAFLAALEHTVQHHMHQTALVASEAPLVMRSREPDGERPSGRVGNVPTHHQGPGSSAPT